MDRELKGAVRNRVKSQAIEGLVKANDIDVPAALIDSEIDRSASSGCSAFRWQ
ncbi:Trigger factor [Raoultella planticola]|uniref:Trigger factor n=1 Tax=Raoultella planticola TaxID=575 RepID=A0A485DBF1_RAOPL|nr:Trigger factor [Raoultella planticola]